MHPFGVFLVMSDIDRELRRARAVARRATVARTDAPPLPELDDRQPRRIARVAAGLRSRLAGA